MSAFSKIVVSDHKKNLEMKDTEILEMKNKFDSSENKNKELITEERKKEIFERKISRKLSQKSFCF